MKYSTFILFFITINATQRLLENAVTVCSFNKIKEEEES